MSSEVTTFAYKLVIAKLLCNKQTLILLNNNTTQLEHHQIIYVFQIHINPYVSYYTRIIMKTSRKARTMVVPLAKTKTRTIQWPSRRSGCAPSTECAVDRMRAKAGCTPHSGPGVHSTVITDLPMTKYSSNTS